MGKVHSDSKDSPKLESYKKALSMGVAFGVKQGVLHWSDRTCSERGHIMQREHVDVLTGEVTLRNTEFAESILSNRKHILKWIFQEDVKNVLGYAKMNGLQDDTGLLSALKKVRYISISGVYLCIKRHI